MSNAHPFKTTRRAGSPSAGGNALSMETHISSTTAHPQYQKKGDTSQSIDLSAHTDARGAEDHASYYLRVSELETDYSSYEANDIQSIDILNAATRPGNPKKCVVTTILLKDVLRQHDASAELKFVKNTKVAVSVVGDAASPTITYWSSGEAPSVVGIEAFVSLYDQIKTNRRDLDAILLTDSASLAYGNPLKGKAADYNHTHSLDDIDRNGLISSIQSSVNTILSDYVTRDMLKENGGWELALSEVGIYPESNDGTKTTTETVVVDGVSTEVSHVEVINLNQRTRQGHSIYKVETEDGLVGIPSEIANLRAETANLETSDSNLIVDVQVTENTMHDNDANIVSDPGETTRAVTQRLVTSTDGVVSAGYVAESIHDNRAQTFFRTGHAYGYSGYIGTIAALVGTSPKGLVEMSNDEVVEAFYDVNNSNYTFGYFRATYAEKLRWSGVAGELFVPVKVTAFATGVAYFEVNIDNEYVATEDTTPDANKQYFIKASNKGYSVGLGTAPSVQAELDVYNKLFGITDNKSLTNDVSSYLCGRFSTYSEVTDLVVDDPATGDVVEVDPRITGADLVTDAIGSAFILEKLFDKSTAELGSGTAIPRENDKVVDGAYVVDESNAIFRKGLFIKTSDTSVIAGKKYYSKDLSGDTYSEVLDLVAGSTLTEGDYYEVITLEDVFNARSAAEELTTTGSINVKTLVDVGAARIVYDFDEQGRLIVWGPWDQLATKHYVDKKLENVSVEGGSGFGGGVIDGVLCKDADGNDVITELTKANGGLSTSMTKIEYTVKNDCYLAILLTSTDVEGDSDSNGDCLNVLINNSPVAKLGDNWDGNDSGSVGIPVKGGSNIIIQGVQPGTKMFGQVSNSSKLVFKEYRLNSLNVTVGLPNYDKGDDITKEVVRTAVGVSKGYKAKSDGFVLFRCTPSFGKEEFTPAEGYGYYVSGRVAGTVVAYTNINSASVSSSRNVDMAPVRKGDIIDWSITKHKTSAVDTSVIATDLINAEGVTCTFFPLVGTGESTSGPIEYAIAECPFTLTGTTNPFLPGSTVPSLDKRTLDPGSIKSRTGRDVNLKEATIKFRMDVFLPKRNADGSITIDANGYTVPDDSKPMFSNDACGYYIAGSNSFYSKPFEIVEINGKSIVKWNVQLNSQVILPSLLTINPSSGSLPNVDYTATEGNGSNNNLNYNNLQAKAASLGLSNYYIRLTAIIDPNRKNVIESKSGMFVTGDIAKDENGKVCKTLVPYTEWAAKQDSDGKYVYEYTVKTDCWLYTNFLVHTSGVTDCVVIKINGETIDAYNENSGLNAALSENCNQLSMPVRRGTKIGFHSKEKPTMNLVGLNGNPIIDGEEFAIKIVEFKMGTELNPAQFPSLAVRVLDCDMGEVDSNLGKTYTWTESELRQIFGPMYSVDESRIEFSTTFYKATSAEGFDDASVKMTAITDCKLDGIAYSKFPTTISKNDVGENIISVYVPDKTWMLTPVSWDATNAKFIMNTTAIQLEDSDMPAGVRMRLNMHISDRRGDMPDELLPNGISPNSRMVRQGDMNITAGNALGNVAYTNEITITESGTCIIMSNFDSDSTGVDFTTVAVQALIGGNWTTIQTSSTQTIQDGRGVQSFNFPVEAGTKLRIATDAGITGAAGDISGTRNELNEMFTHAHQALCWVIPTGKYQNPELNLPGSAGVIDGSIWKDKDGNELITEVTDGNTRTSCTYHVKNDCYLCIKTYSGDIGNAAGNVGIDIFVNGTNMGSMLADVNQDGAGVDNLSIGLPVAEGSVVELKSNNGTSNLMATAAGRISFTEFKLRATNVLAAMPDWDESKAVSITSGWVAQNDGFVVEDGAGIPWLKVNDVEVLRGGNGNNNIDHNGWVAVSRGDVVTFGAGAVKFYPVKMTRTEYPDKMIVPNWSGTGTAIASGGAAPADGWVVVNTTDRMDDGSLAVLVNGITVWRSRDGNNNTKGHTANVPVAKNDIITVSTDYYVTMVFYPAKPATTVTSEADVLEEKINKNATDIAANATEIETIKSTLSSMDNTAAILSAVYPVGSVYISVSGSLPAPIAAIGTWVQMATGKTLWNVDPTVTAPGTEIAAGLPNIKGQISGARFDTHTGAFSTVVETGLPESGDDWNTGLTIEFDASKSNEIYGKSDTVQPPAIAVTMWQRTA